MAMVASESQAHSDLFRQQLSVMPRPAMKMEISREQLVRLSSKKDPKHEEQNRQRKRPLSIDDADDTLLKKKQRRRTNVDHTSTVMTDQQKLQCAALVRVLITHPFGKVFNNHVEDDPQVFVLPSRPIGLNSIKTKLMLPNFYLSPQSFSDDVTFVFSNTMSKTAPGTDLYLMGKELRKVFESRWILLQKSWTVAGAKDTLLAALQPTKVSSTKAQVILQREKSRMALENMEKTVDFCDNTAVLKDFYDLIGPWSDSVYS